MIAPAQDNIALAGKLEMKPTTLPVHPSAIHELRRPIASFAALIGVSVISAWIGRGTQFHQFAIGIVLSAGTLGVAQLVFEFCWQAVLRVARHSDPSARD